MKSLGTLSALILSCTIMTGCSNSSNEPEETPRADIQLTPAQKVISQSNVKFAVDLLKAANTTTGNVLVAPFSASSVLSMLAEGSDAATSSEIINALHLNATNTDELNGYYKTVTNGLLNADSKTDFSIANAIWVDGSMKPSAKFEETCNDFYKVYVGKADFMGNHSKATQDINTWISKATGGKIGTMFDEGDINELTRFCVTNASTFDGKWKFPFDKDKTKSGNFKNHKGITENVMMMMTSMTDVLADTTGNADFIEMPYGNGAFVMDIIVPKGDINAYVGNLSAEAIESLIASAKKSIFTVHMPRFATKVTNKMSPVLKELGIKNAFVESPCFKNMFDASSAQQASRLFLANFNQKMNIEVSESGTKVEVATGTSGADSKVSGGDFFIDTPFVYMIREVSTGTILFVGKAQSIKAMN